jgi:hypothetical protein
MSSQALLAACYSKACAPPPAGRGGSVAGQAAGRIWTRARIQEQALSGKPFTVTRSEAIKIVDSIASSSDPRDELILDNMQIKGTSLFRASMGSFGRHLMPQLEDAVKQSFIDDMRSDGVQVETTAVVPSTLRASQGNLNGPKVGRILQSLRINGPESEPPIIVSNDGYIIDGHHRWAAVALLGLERPNVRLNVVRIDLPFGKVFAPALRHAKGQGAPRQPIGQFNPPAVAASLVAACHSKACAPPPAGRGGSDSGGGGTSALSRAYSKVRKMFTGKVKSSRFGMVYSKTSAAIVARARKVSDANWEKLPVQTLKCCPKLVANEKYLTKPEAIEKVVSGKVPFRKGYVTKLWKDAKGKLHIVDGHHRVAMYQSLRKDMPVRIMSEAELQGLPTQ